MTTRYQKSQIEDVAVLLRFHHDINVSGPIAIATLAGHFADLFAADNPRDCPACDPDGVHGGFDREQFLKACGLKETS